MQDKMNLHYINLLAYAESLGHMLQKNHIDPLIYAQINTALAHYEQWGRQKINAIKILQTLEQHLPADAYEQMPNFTHILPFKPAPYYAKYPFCYAFATNDAYAPYLGVALYSMREHCVYDTTYDICVLHTDLSMKHQQNILSLQSENFHIRFINITPYLNELDTCIFKIHAHFSKEAYYRFFIPKIFENYQRVLYLDCDMIFISDIDKLFQMDLSNMPMGAVLEYKFKCKVEYDTVLNNYAKNTLKLDNVQNYFNSGLLILDIEKLVNINFTHKCLDKLQEVIRPRTVDQCIINSIMQGKVKFINPQWNLQTHVNLEELKKYVSHEDFNCYINALQNAHIIHFCSPEKPWISTQVPFANIWWHYAQKTSFIEM